MELNYIEDKIMPYLANQKEKCTELMAKISEAATGKKTELGLTGTMNNIEEMENNNKKTTTVPKEFNLTKPKPKQLPEVERI